MELERWRALLCVIEEGSLSAAAERLHYTASGISRMMAALENEAGFPLLYRRHEGVIPTPECLKLLPSVREFLFHGEQCMAQAAAIRGLETGTVTIGTAYSAFYDLLASVTALFRQKHPGILVQLRSGFSSQMATMLEERQIDLCIISRREGAFDWYPLGQDELTAWLPAGHPLADCPEVPASLFGSEPYIEIFPGQDSDNARFFRTCGIKPNTQFTTTDSHSACAMVEAGLGIALNNALNSQDRGDRIKVVPLSPRQSVEIGIAAVRSPSPAMQIFLDELMRHTREADALPAPLNAASH